MLLGIDLGTTFSCVAHLEDGVPVVIPNSSGEKTTPSVLWFDGEEAWVGESARARAEVTQQPPFEFIKSKMGSPVEIPPKLYGEGAPTAHPFSVGGYKYGAAGLSAIILRKLKQDAIRCYEQTDRIPSNMQEENLNIDAVITVPSYFGDRERDDTRLAGFAAGLNVVSVINEPTAAALSYGMNLSDNQTLFVFDLGGGTCDVTILRIEEGKTNVITSSGNNTLGGRDWDDLIDGYLYNEFHRQTGSYISDKWLGKVREKATEAKIALSSKSETKVTIRVPSGEMTTTLYRTPPETRSVFSMDDGESFYFEQRSESLLQRCRSLCVKALEDAMHRTSDGRERPMEWGDIDTVVLAGGSTRMPMIKDLVESVTGHKVQSQDEDLDHDTAIAKGAAIYGTASKDVRDVAAKSLGLEVIVNGRNVIDHVIKKDTPLPVEAERSYKAGANARLNVYEGESTNPAEHENKRGELTLGNEAGDVRVAFTQDESGFLRVEASYPPDTTEEVDIRNKYYSQNNRAIPLREKVQSIWIHE